MPIEQPTEFELLNQSEDPQNSSLGYTPIFNRHRRRSDRIAASFPQQIVDAINVPVIASGAIGDARGIVAALALANWGRSAMGFLVFR